MLCTLRQTRIACRKRSHLLHLPCSSAYAGQHHPFLSGRARQPSIQSILREYEGMLQSTLFATTGCKQALCDSPIKCS